MAVRRNNLRHLGFRHPNEGIVDLDLDSEQGGHEPAQVVEHARVCGSGRPRAHHLRRNWKIETNHAVFEKKNSVSAQHARHNNRQGRKQEGPGPLGSFDCQQALPGDADGDMQDPTGEPICQLGCELLLALVHLGRRLVAHESDVASVAGKLVDRSA